MTPRTVDAALAEGRAEGLDRLDSHLLLAHVLDRSRTWLLAHGEARVGATETERWRVLVARRSSGEPLAYLIGRKEFHGLTFHVDPRVLTPRPETETLVDWAVELLRIRRTELRLPHLVDLGTGSGAIAAACKASVPEAFVFASDSSAGALEVAQANSHRLGLSVEYRLGSWWRPWAGARFDMAVSNPPYIREADPHLAALRHEPLEALTGGPDGLGAIREVIRSARAHLAPAGRILLEHGFDQAESVVALLQNAGFEAIETRSDIAGLPRCTSGRAPWPTC